VIDEEDTVVIAGLATEQRTPSPPILAVVNVRQALRPARKMTMPIIDPHRLVRMSAGRPTAHHRERQPADTDKPRRS
jgi:hypothetical protein